MAQELLNQISLDVFARTATITTRNANDLSVISQFDFNNVLVTLSERLSSITNTESRFRANLFDIGRWMRIVEDNILDGYTIASYPAHSLEVETDATECKVKFKIKNTLNVMVTILNNTYNYNTKIITVGPRPLTVVTYSGFKAFYLALFEFFLKMQTNSIQWKSGLGELIINSFEPL